MKSSAIIATLIFILSCASLKAQQPVSLPEQSQKAVVTQRIGLTDVTITYHSPLVKGRKVWGEMCPYKQVWRAGANENTTISFTNDVTIEGQHLAAGTYGLHMIPDENEWTIIFSKNHTSWGSFTYNKDEDALRVTVKPEVVPFQEWLSYEFTDREPNSAVAALVWEKLKVPFKIDVDVNSVVLANIRNELRSIPGFTWQGWCSAANYCLTNNTDYDEALQWAQTSISINENFTNLQVKSGLQAKKGDATAAAETMKKAMTVADENQLNTYGYQLMSQNKLSDALEIFKQNVKRHPDSWNAYDSLGEAYGDSGDKKQAVANYKIALTTAPENQKQRIEDTVKKLEGK